jgi:hypothetical protein
MKQEYQEKLSSMKAWLDSIGVWINSGQKRPEEEIKRIDIPHYEMVHELANTQDLKVLSKLLDFYVDKNAYELGDFYSFLEEAIWDNYSAKQISDALHDKFRELCNFDAYTCTSICTLLWEEGLFEDFRKMFNASKAEGSEGFLRLLERFHEQHLQSTSYRGINLGPMIATLREDMKHWGNKVIPFPQEDASAKR